MRSDGNKGVRLSRNGLGKITSKIPSDIRKGFVKVINNPVVQTITFATIAYQFGYSINEIAQGNHHPLNYYWTTSSGIKLASMGIRPASIGISFAMKGGTSILRGLSIASKILGRLSMVTAVADVLITIGVEIYERIEYTKAIAGQVPLLPGDEQAEVFFAKVIKLFTGMDVEEEYEEKIRIKGYLTFFKARAIELLDKDPNIAAVVQYANSIIKEEYDEIIRNNKSICNTVSDIQHFPAKTYCIRNCTLKRINEDFSFKEVNSLNSLFLLDLSKTLPLISHTLVMTKWWKEFECEVIKGFNSDKGEECFYKLRNKQAYFIDLSAKHLPHITLSEYNNGLRVVSAPLRLFINRERYDKKSYAYLNTRCNINRIYMTYKQAFTLSNEPFIFTKLGNNQEGKIVYLPGPKRLTAAANYPAAMHVSKGEVDYTGSQYHNNVFIINSNTKGILVGGTTNNVVVMNYNAIDYIKVDLHKGKILKNSEHIELHNIYDYISYSTARQDVIDNCKTRYLDVGSNIYSNTIYISDDCQDRDRVLVKVRERNIYYVGQKQAIFVLSRSSNNAIIVSGKRYFSHFSGPKNNTDVIYFNNTDISQLKINEQQASYSLEFLADDKQSTVTNIKIDSFKKLVIETEKAGVIKVVEVQDKSLFDLVGDMEYQKLDHSRIDIGSKIVEGSKKRSKAKIFVNITDSKGLMAYEAAKDIISSNSLGIPISLVQAKRIVNDVVYEAIIGGIYTSEVVTDFSCENIDCKKVITIEVNSHSSDYVVKIPQAYERNRPVLSTLEVITVPYASTSNRVINLIGDDVNPEDIECEAGSEYRDVNIYVNQGSFKIILRNYLWDLKCQYIVFQFNQDSKFYKINSISLKFEPVLYNYEKNARADYSSFRYYKPDERGLEIYHNQPEDGNKVGFIDLKDRSILDCDMEIIDGDLILLHNNTTFIEMKNWSTYQPARKVIFAFNNTILECIASDCELEDKFNKKKIALLLEKEIFDAIDQDNMDEAEDLAGRIKSTDVEKLTSFDRECASIKCQGNGYLHLAAKEGKWNVVKFLVDKCVDIMATDEHGKIPFCYAVENGYVEVVDFMWKKAGSLGVQYEMLKALGCETFESAIKNGYVGILDSLWEKVGSLGVQYGMLRADDYEAFRLAVKNDRFLMLDSLWKKAGSLGVQYEMLRVNDYEAFRSAAENSRSLMLDSLWKKAGSLGIQYEMLKANDYEAFRLAVKNDRFLMLDYLWGKVGSLDVQYCMLKANDYEAFRSAVKDNRTDILDYLWRKAESLGVQNVMLKANDYEAFRLAARSGNVSILDSLWEEVGSVIVQNNILKANDYEVLAHVIMNHGCAHFLERFRSVIDIDKESMIFSPYIKGIATQGWKKCLEAIAHDNNEEMLGWVWQNFILPLRLDVKQEISEFYQELKQKFAEAGDSSKRAEESVQEKKKTIQHKRRHHHGDHKRHHLSRRSLAVDLGNQPEMVEGSANQEFSWIGSDSSAMESTSGTNKLSSWVNVFANTLVGAVKSISQFISSPFKPAIGMESSKAITTQGADINGTLLLLDVFIRKITGQKYISTVDQSISQPEAQGYALNIIEKFEKVLNEAAIKSGISVTNLNFDPMKPQSDIVGQLRNGEFSEILKTLYSSAKQACPE